MNVLIINASPRKKGVTSILLNEIRNTLDLDKIIVEMIRIQDLNIKPCIGCLKCRPDKICVLPEDDSHILAEKIKHSDVIIFGTPVFWGNMPGTLKIFFDRNVPLFEYCEAKAIKYIPKPKLKNKKAILIISGGSPFPFNLLKTQSRGAIQSLKTILKAGGIKITAILNVPDTYNFAYKKDHYLTKAKKIANSLLNHSPHNAR